MILAALVAEGAALDADVAVNIDGAELKTGKRTFLQRLSARAVTQHESVLLTVLVAQKLQRPARLFWYPQFAGSFCAP